jgi:hypothetical protein
MPARAATSCNEVPWPSARPFPVSSTESRSPSCSGSPWKRWICGPAAAMARRVCFFRRARSATGRPSSRCGSTRGAGRGGRRHDGPRRPVARGAHVSRPKPRRARSGPPDREARALAAAVDRAWFRRHPGRGHAVRLLIPGEAPAAFPVPADHVPIAAVRRLPGGGLARVFGALRLDAPHFCACEACAAALFYYLLPPAGRARVLDAAAACLAGGGAPPARARVLPSARAGNLR